MNKKIITLNSIDLSSEISDVMLQCGIIDVASALAWLDRLKQLDLDNELLDAEKLEELEKALSSYRVGGYQHKTSKIPPAGVLDMTGIEVMSIEKEVFDKPKESLGKHTLEGIINSREGDDK